MHFASNIIFGPTRAGCRRRASMRSVPAHAPSACASGRWATSCRSIIRSGSPRRSRSSIRCSAGGMELGLVPGINAGLFPSVRARLCSRKSPTLEFVDYLRAAFGEKQPFSFHGENSTPKIRGTFGAAGAAAASAALDDEPRSANARILRARTPSIPAISWSIRAPMLRRATACFSTNWTTAPAGRASRTSPTAPSSMWTRATTRRSRSRFRAQPRL